MQLKLITLSIVALVLAGMQHFPTSRADQVPPGSGAYYHVGDNLWSVEGNQANAAAFDGNSTSRALVGPGGLFSPICGAAINYTFSAPANVRADMAHVRVSNDITGSATSCLGVGLKTSDGGQITLVATRQGCATCTDVIDAWANFTLPQGVTVTGLWVQVSRVCSSCSATTTSTGYVNEAEVFDKNSTTSDPLRALANQAAAGLQCYATGSAIGNFASNPYVAPLGTFYVLIPSIMPASTTSPPNPMQVNTSAGGVSTSFVGWSRVMPDITGQKSGAVAIWRVTTLQSGIVLYARPAGGGPINATDTVCAFSRMGAIASSTLSNGYVTAPLTAWGGTASDVWGIIHMANGYPINSVYDSDLTRSTAIFDHEVMGFGPVMFSTGTAGQSTTISLANIPAAARAGNAILVAIGQPTTAAGSSAGFTLTVNGYPARALTNAASATHGFDYALFLIDDVALRNGLDNLNGTIGQSGLRPLSSETYQLTIGSGYDAGTPVWFGNTIGTTGHAGLVCYTVCTSNAYITSFLLPSDQHNQVTFNVKGRNGSALEGVRVLLTNDSTAKMTDANGTATFQDRFTNAVFTLAKPGYVELCAEYRFRDAPGVQTGSGWQGCPYVAAYNATFEAEMSTLIEANAGSDGTAFLGGNAVLPVVVSFEGNTTRYVPDRVTINLTRSEGADIFLGLDRVDSTTGLIQHNILRATYWKPFEGNAFAFYYPNKAKSANQDVGLYVLWVMNDTGAVLNHTKFFILPPGASSSEYDVTITEDFLRSIENAGYVSARQTFQSQYQASALAVQKSVREQVYEDFRVVSEYGWFVIGFLLFLATVRAFRR